MAVRQSGFTRASSLGPIAHFIGGHGASIMRLLQDVDLPPALLDRPDMLLPLREQFRLLDRGARATGDAHFGARLGRHVQVSRLSAFGKWVSDAPTLGDAIRRSEQGLNAMLQTATDLQLVRRGPLAYWSIEFLDPECDGRYQNELLGISYLIDCVRAFAGPRWSPNLVLTTAPRGTTKSGLEEIFRAEVSTGHRVTTIEFDARLLDARNPRAVAGSVMRSDAGEPPMPSDADLAGAIAAVVSLALQEGPPRLEWIAAKLGMSPRSLQRKLANSGTTYLELLERLLCERARSLIGSTRTPLIEIALSLGYSDPAHFSRAFKRWTGVSPSDYRRTFT
ncbi:MAG: AraC family transcriptional regulator ligand-binding domain-containing protein [Hyphomicrobium sp.]